MSQKKLSKEYYAAFKACHKVAVEAVNEIPELSVKSHFASFLPGDTCSLFKNQTEYVKVSAKKPCLVCVVTFDPSL